jgi:hypothetical protein
MIYMKEDLDCVQVRIVTAELTWNCMELCKMGTNAIIGDTRELSPQVAKDCKANPANY